MKVDNRHPRHPDGIDAGTLRIRACPATEGVEWSGTTYGGTLRIHLEQAGEHAMQSVARSVNGVPIRLADERWAHITEQHCELAGLRLEVLETNAHPERVLAGGAGELLARRETEAGKWLVAVYRQLGDDGFVITAFLRRRRAALERRKQLWP